jgi:hypothetical protein
VAILQKPAGPRGEPLSVGNVGILSMLMLPPLKIYPELPLSRG